MKARALTLAVALSAAVATGTASGATITNETGVWPFDGFDWAQGGTAYTQGFEGTDGDLFTLSYFAVATALVTEGQNYVPTGLDTIANGAPGPVPLTGDAYEYTIVASLNEQVQTCTPEAGGNTSCEFNVLDGTFSIYYDPTPDANSTTGSLGTGFQGGDSILIISGTVLPLAGQTFDTTTGSNSTTLQGIVTFTNNLYVNPDLLGTTFTSTLQLGAAQTSYVDPGGFNGTPWAGLQGPGDIVFQADANQSFTERTVPEPMSLALIGLGLGAAGWSLRRRRS